MKFGFWSFPSLAALWLALCLPASAQFFPTGDKVLVTPSLIADTKTIEAGKPFTVGVKLIMAPGWHTYWQFGGDSGAPTQIAWELPAGFKIGAIQWPLPTAHPSAGDQLTFIYENEVMLLVEITPPATLPPGDMVLKAKLSWLVCEETCVPGSGEVALSLPQGPAQPTETELFAKWRAQIPKRGGLPFEVRWERSSKEVKLHLSGLPKEFKAEFFPIPPSIGVKPGHPQTSAVADDGARTFTVPINEGGAENLAWQGVIVTAKGEAPREGWHVAADETATAQTATAADDTPVSPAGATFLGMLGAAFIGGLLLNLMPCVLPVIALKIFGFVAQASEEPRRVFRLGLAFVAGVFVFFLALAFIAIAIHAAGGRFNYGSQFQNGYLLTTLIALVFIFAMSMFGVFEITLGGDAATKLDALSRKEGYGGAFVHGLFTTLLGTSCTAPFLGPVLGFAIVQPPPVVIVLFLAIAAGMSLPYFLLTWRPAWMKYLPKPGVWMERVKQFMGFILLAVVVWLLGVVGDSRGIDVLIAVCAFLLLLGVACWTFGVVRRKAIAWPVIAVLLAIGWFTFLKNNLTAAPATNGGGKRLSQPGGIPWEAFTPERLDAAIQSGRPVFVDFTADWCLNCKYNEKFVLETEPVRAAFREKNVIPIKADWTNADPAITALLKKFNRAGVPVYVIYPPGSTEPIVLPEILTQSLLLRQLAEIQR